MNGWLPFESGEVLFSVLFHPHHTCWELFVLLLIFSTQDHNTFQTTHKLCVTADGIYLPSLLLERPHLEQKTGKYLLGVIAELQNATAY